MGKVSGSTRRLYEYGEVRWHQRSNPHILTGYLRDQTTFECLFNFSRRSNQLVNIWTHVIAAFYVTIETVDDVVRGVAARGGNELDRVVFSLFNICFVACLLSSVAHHSFNSHRRKNLARKCFTLDWSCCLATGCSCYALNAFCLFRRDPFWLAFYMFGFAAVGFLFLLFSLASPSLSDKKSRVKLTATMVFLCTLPLVHCKFSAEAELSRLIGRRYASNLSWQVVSAAAYAAHFPERCFPERFDLIGQSHNLWHVLCAVAIQQWKHSALEFLSYNCNDTGNF